MYRRMLFGGIANKKRGKNKRARASSTCKRRRSPDHYKLKDMRELSNNDEAFHLSPREIVKIIKIIRSRKTPTPETYMQWDEYGISFYLKMCTCFGVDHQHLEDNSEDDDDKNEKTKEMPLKEREQSMECNAVDQHTTKEISEKEFVEKFKNMEMVCYREVLTGPFEFGSYSSGTTRDRIPYHLYLLVKEAVDIMRGHNNTNDGIDLITVEKKITFFCTYFYSHLPTGWNYNRDIASSLIASYDTTANPRYLMAGYTPIEGPLDKLNYDEETKLSLFEMVDVMSIIHSRKSPSFWKLGGHMISFYCKVCSCFGINYQLLETASKDDVCLMNTGRKPTFI